MLNIDGLNASAEKCLGWPYVSPGTNDKNGIDCSGLFVRMYKEQGANIYHGSNTIFREYCSATGKIGSGNDLAAGMAVFKIKAWADSDKGNRWYGKGPGNLSHIGYVLSANPLKIIHASSAAGCVTIDTKVGKWAWWGRMKDVDYGTSGGGDIMDENYQAEVTGGRLSLREHPMEGADRLAWIPTGTILTVSDYSEDWASATYGGKKGYVMRKWLLKITEGVIAADDAEKIDKALSAIEDAWEIIMEQMQVIEQQKEIIGSINGRG